MDKQNHFSTYTLSSGLRSVHLHLPDTTVEYAGVIINAGSRDDAPGQEGLAHFVEHTIFKGTSSRSSRSIINTMELCGGELNAYTSKENTVVYSLFPSGNLRKAINLIADILTDSQFPESELIKEKDVVCDEIDSYLDMPSEAIFDDFEELLFAGSSLAHNILGSKDIVSSFTADNCKDYLRKYYTADNMVFFYSGPSAPDHVLKLAESAFRNLPLTYSRPLRPSPIVSPPFNSKVNFDGIHQAHVLLGGSTVDMFSPHRYALSLLSNILGGPGMNSMLNVSLRERRGLVYNVEASTTLLSDTGLFTIYFGCDKEDALRCKRLVLSDINRLASKPIAPRTFAQLQRQYVGQMLVAADNRENFIMSSAKSLLYRNEIISIDHTQSKILELSPTDVQQMAQSVADSLTNSLIFC